MRMHCCCPQASVLRKCLYAVYILGDFLLHLTLQISMLWFGVVVDTEPPVQD
jgi:hypothetical protein